MTVTGNGMIYTITLAVPISVADRVTISIDGDSIASFSRGLDVLPGDVNDDGIVNSRDQVIVRNAITGYGQVSVPLAFLDLDGDGVVDVKDYNLARKYAGKRLP